VGILDTQTLMEGMTYAEGIRWGHGQLWVSDIHAHRILKVDPSTGQASVVAELDDRPSGLGFGSDAALLAVTMLERKLVRIGGDGATVVAHLGGFISPDDIVNDMVVDGEGRAYIGFHAFPDPSQGTDGILLVAPDGRVTVVAGNLKMPNGMVVSPDGRLIVAETRAGRIVQYRIGRDGSLGARTVFAELAGHKPDGIALSDEGTVWVCSASSGELLAVNEGSGVISSFEIADGRWPVTLVFGGPERDRLFVVTSKTSTEELYRVGRHRDRDATLISESRIDWCDVGAVGAGWP
jgi:sugar lactone lactonase YvrE